MHECNHCGHAEMAHGKRKFGTSLKVVCGVTGCECVR